MKLFNKTWQIGRFNGVEIRLHISMLLIAPFIFYLFHPKDLWGWLSASSVMIGLLVCVLLHEIGHTLAAQVLGIAVTKIVIWPLGGFTSLGRAPEKPVHKLAINAAGPLVSFLLALMLGGLWLITWLALNFLWDYPAPFWAGLIESTLLFLAILNGVLVVFNLLPIYPLDGGNMFNALLEMLFGKALANTISIVVGIPFLLGLALLGIFTGDPILLVFCVMLALGIGSLNPQSSRWIALGINYVFKRAGYYHLTEDYDEAIRAHTRALEKNPKDISHLLGRAIAHVNLVENDLASKDLETILQLAPDQVVALELCGELCSLKKEDDSALAYFARVKALKPDWTFPWFDCGGLYLDQKQYQQALDEFNQAIKLQAQSSPLFFVVRSMAYYRLQDLKAARRDQEEAMRLSPQYALVMSDVNLRLSEGYLDWAQDYYGWVLAKDPRQWLAYQGRADAYAANHQPDAAIADYDRALGLAPKEALLYLRRGLARQKAGHPEQAADDFRQALALARKSHLRRRAQQLLAETAPA
ncbi:MAG: site-2 protease family protein [Anaerolineales bacterium]